MGRIATTISVIACLSCGCGLGTIDDADIYGVYLADADGYVDILVLDTNHRYTRMYWEEAGGKQIYSGDWALMDWMGDTRVDFHQFGRLYENDYPTQPGNWPALVKRSLLGNVRFPISLDDNQFYNKTDIRTSASSGLFDSLIPDLTKK
jgi:hypothetical protein